MNLTNFICSVILVSLPLVSCSSLKTPVKPSFTERQGDFSEDFNRLDTVVWETQLYSFDGNGCNMIPQNVTLNASKLSLIVSTNTNKSLPKLYNGGEIGSKIFFSYGLFLVRMKPAGMKGAVSSFFLMNRWQPSNWEHKEIDIEFLGKDHTKVQLTTHDFQNGGKDWKNSSATISLGFDYTKDFHEYGILWKPNSVEWFVDGKLLRKETLYVPHEPLQMRLNFYAGDNKVPGILNWLSSPEPLTTMHSTLYDWVKYYPEDQLPAEYFK